MELRGLVLLLWDVDHTLIDNGGVSKDNFALAFRLITGRDADRPARTGGRTDAAVLADLLTDNGEDPARHPWARQRAALVQAVHQHRDELRERGRALPGAVVCLAELATRPDVLQSVLTGNVEENARVKLGTFGLDRWLDFSIGGFATEHPERWRLVPQAQAKATGRGFDPATGITVLVGDTLADVEAGRLGGARVIGIASGENSRADLAAAGADAVLADLTDLDAFLAALAEVRRLGRCTGTGIAGFGGVITSASSTDHE